MSDKCPRCDGTGRLFVADPTQAHRDDPYGCPDCEHESCPSSAENPRTPARRRIYPGGYIGCPSTLSGESFMRGEWRVGCLLPQGHDGKHWEGTDAYNREWTDEQAD